MTSMQSLQLRIQLLGGFSIRAGDKGIGAEQFRLHKSRSLLKLLALAPNHRLHRDQLMELLWPENDPERAANNLHQAVYAVRRVLDAAGLPSNEILQFKNETFILYPDLTLWIDVEAFETAAARARHGQDSVIYQKALDLYTGDLLPEDPYEDWAANRRDSLRQERLRLLLELGQLEEARQAFEPAITCFQQAVSVEPALEEAHTALMRLYAQTSQRSAALAQYETCRQTLKKELGIEPSHHTTSLHRRIASGEITTPEEVKVSRTAEAAPVESAPSPPKANLPTYLIPFVGRKNLIKEIRERLMDPTCRLLTLTGPGGSGKTRLAVEVAAGMLEAFPDGVYFVPLAGVQSSSSTVPAIAQAIGFSFYEGRDPSLQLLDYLRNKSLLLVLDNFEHLLTALALQGEQGATIVTKILSTVPSVKVLVTSRIRLNLMGEILVPVFGMEITEEIHDRLVDELQSSAVQLFLEGARRVIPAYAPNAQDLRQVVHICRLVQGMPLSILLTSAWMRLLSPAEIADQVAAHNLDILESDWTDVPARQRSLRAVFDHSWRLLSARQRAVFAGLSIFRSGLTLAAAQAVCAATLHDLKLLVDHSLLQLSSPGRYELHELLRQYGEEKLNELPEGGLEMRDRHTRYYFNLLQRCDTESKGPRQLEAGAELDREIDNIRAAWSRAIERKQTDLLKAGTMALGNYYHWRRRYVEGEKAFQQAADLLASSDRLNQPGQVGVWAVCLAWQEFCHQMQGRTVYDKKPLQNSLEQLEATGRVGVDIRREKAFTLFVMGAIFIGNDIDRLNSALALYRELDSRWEIAQVLIEAGSYYQAQGMNNEAIRFFQESLEICQEMDIPLDTNNARRNLAFALSIVAQTERAERMLKECIAQCRQLGDQFGLANGLYILSTTLAFSGKHAERFAPLAECAAIFDRLGDRVQLARAHNAMAIGYAHLGNYDQAWEGHQRSLAVFHEVDNLYFIGTITGRLGEVALALGQIEKAVQLLQDSLFILKKWGALSQTCQVLPILAIAGIRMGNLSVARPHLTEALQLVAGLQDIQPNLYTLLGAVLFMTVSGKPERAVELFALAVRHPFVANSALFHDLVGKSVLSLRETLPPEVVAAAEERGWKRDLWATIAELKEDPLFSLKINSK